eukprot:GEMP01021820.1.p2 GENE.GEMP01021820.1~~GEMP01021820.1.p2  ORF type:complete len:199 (+),score=51.87 GEMP01021820.1:236-832(+)
MCVDSNQESAPSVNSPTMFLPGTDVRTELEERVRKIALSVNMGDMKDAVAILKTCTELKRSLTGEKSTNSFQSSVDAKNILSPLRTTAGNGPSPLHSDLMSPVDQSQCSEDGDKEGKDRVRTTIIDIDFDDAQQRASMRPSAQMKRSTVQYDEGVVDGDMFCCAVKSQTDRWGFLSLFAQAQSPTLPPVKSSGGLRKL